MEERVVLDKKEIKLYYSCNEPEAFELGKAFSGFVDLINIFHEQEQELSKTTIVSIKVTGIRNGSIDIKYLIELLDDLKGMILSDGTDIVLRTAGLLSICSNAFSFLKNISKKVIEPGSFRKIRALKKLLAPIKEAGEELVVESDKDKVVISKEVADFVDSFQETTKQENVSEFTSEGYYEIISLSFKKGSKWQLDDGASISSVTIEDDDFIEMINKQKLSFHKNDIMKCRIQSFQYETPKGLRKEMKVIKVLEYKHMPIQESFEDFETKGETIESRDKVE